MSLNSNLKTKLQLDYPFKKDLKKNRNFNDFSIKSAHFFFTISIERIIQLQF